MWRLNGDEQTRGRHSRISSHDHDDDDDTPRTTNIPSSNDVVNIPPSETSVPVPATINSARYNSNVNVNVISNAHIVDPPPDHDPESQILTAEHLTRALNNQPNIELVQSRSHSHSHSHYAPENQSDPRVADASSELLSEETPGFLIDSRGTSRRSSETIRRSHEENNSATSTDTATATVTATNTSSSLHRSESSATISSTLHNNDDDDDDLSTATAAATVTYQPTDEMLQLATEREIHRRKSSSCFILAGIFLFRLWVECITTGDIAIILVNVLLTSYFWAWMRQRRAIQEDFNLRIEGLRRDQIRMETGDEEEMSADEENGERARRRGDPVGESRRRRRARRNNGAMTSSNYDFLQSDHIDMEMLSFQAQLAFAIMESQRHIIENGGYGHPDGGDADGGDNNNSSGLVGVSNNAKQLWDAFAYDLKDKRVQMCADLQPQKIPGTTKTEDPSCCICLCEYEEGDMLNQMKCGHVYHKECIDSWCKNHTRCPLCNFDLEGNDGYGSGDDDNTATIV